MKRYLILLLFVLVFNFIKGQTDTEFWFVAPEVSADHGDSPVLLRITTATLPADVEITMPANTANFPTLNYSIAANSTITINLTTLNLQDEVEHIYDFLDGVNGKSNKGIHIVTTNPVTVYYEVNRSNNCDIFALKGKNALGTEFYGVFQNYGYNMSGSGWGDPAYSALEIVAIEDGTVVTFESTQGQDFYGWGVGTFNVTLNKGQTLSLVPDWNTNVPTGNPPACPTGKYANDFYGRAGPDHLSGVRVTSTKNIAITKKDDSVRYRCIGGWPGGCYDLIGDQLVPLDILGLEYIAMRGGLHELGYPGDDNEAPENLYIVATEDNTNIFIDGVGPVANIDEGETYMYEFWATGKDFVHVRGDKKISVLHISGFGCEVGGAILPPTDKCTGSTQVAITRSTSESFFINLMVWNGAQDEFYINGVLQDGGPGTLFGPSDFQAIPGSANWLVWRSPSLGTGILNVGNQMLVQNTEDVFHLGVINGGASTGCRFGYFSDFNELRVDAEATGSGSGEIRACSYEQIQLYAQGGTTFNWWPAEYLNDPTLSTPIADPPAGTSTLFYVEVSGACGLTDTATVTVTKFPHVEARFSINRGNGCSPLEIIFHETSTQINERYWDFNYSGIGGAIDRETILFGDNNNYDTDTTFTHLFINTSNEPTDSTQNYYIRLLVKNSNDCSDTAYASVIVFPEVTADFTLTDLNDTIGCNPLMVNYVDNSNNEDYYYWTFGDGVSGTNQNPVHIFNNIYDKDTTYTTRLVVRSDDFCRDTAWIDITVHSYLEAGFTIDKNEGCSPLDVTFTNNSVFEDSLVLVYGDGDTLKTNSFAFGGHRYENTGTTVDTNAVMLLVYNDKGCTEVWRDTIIVYPEVRANYNVDAPSPYTGCNSRTFNFTNTSNYGTHTASSFLWTFGDGSTSNSIAVNIPKTYNNTTSSDQTYTFNLHAESQYGCYDDTTNTVIIYRADADFTVDDNEGCSILPVAITNTSVGDDVPAVGGWLWNYGDGSATVATKQPGTHPHNYTNTTNPGVNQPFTLSLTATRNASCTDTKTTTITVNPSISVSFTTIPAAPVSICDSTLVTFNATLAVPTAGTTYLWNFGDGTSATGSSVTHRYRNLTNANAFTYTATVTATTISGCSSTFSAPITVHPYIRSYFSLDASSGCSPDAIRVTPTSYIGIDQYRWDFNGDLVTDLTRTNPTTEPHIYPRNLKTNNSNDVYNIRLTVFNGNESCNKVFTRSNTVFAEAKAMFEPDDTLACNELTFKFRDNSVNPDTYFWDFEDGTTSSEDEPTHTFVNTGPTTATYNVSLGVTTSNGCTHDTSGVIRVRPFVEAAFDINVSAGCSPLTVNITNSSSATQYFWFWDDDNLDISNPDSSITAASFSKTYYNTSGTSRTHQLTLIVGNGQGCYDTLKRAVTVHSSINAGFIYDQPNACNPSDVLFTDTTFNSHTRKWDFGDGSSVENTIATVNKQFTNTGDSDKPYLVTLTAITDKGCQSTASHTVTVYRYVNADFDVDVSEGCSPLNVTITNNSKGTRFYWFWNDTDLTLAYANSTSATPPPHQYAHTAGGVRTDSLTLIVGNDNGCYDTLKRAIKIRSSVVAHFNYNQPDTCNPSPVNFDASTTNPAASEYVWDFGDGSYLTTNTPTVSGKVFTNNTRYDQRYPVVLSVETPEGCIDTYVDTVLVYSRVEADFSIDDNAGCPTFTTLIENTSFGNPTDNYLWYVDGVSVNEAPTNKDPFTGYNFTNTDSVIRKYVVGLDARNDNGCLSYHEDTIYVYERIIADFTMDKENGCPTLNIGFTNNSQVTPDTKYLWNFGDGATSSAFEPSNGHDFFNISRTEDKPYTITLKLTSENYCTHQFSDTILVYNQPLAKFFIDKTSSCPPLVSNMDMRESLGEDMFAWRFGDGTPDNTTEQVVRHQYESTGVGDVDPYKLELWVATNEGCKDSTSLTVNVFPSVTADFNFTYLDNYCSPAEIQFTDTSSAWVVNYYWRFDDDDNNESNLKNPINRYEITAPSDRVYDVFLRVASQYNCWDTITKPVPVYAQPYSSFDISPIVQKFPESSVEITNKSNYGPFNYTWEFGDMDLTTANGYNPSPNPFVYEHWGLKDIRLTIASQTSTCADTSMKTATILPPDVNAAFSTNIDGGCLDNGLEVQFTAESSDYNEEYDYSWDFGDGSDTTGQYVTHIYRQPGTYYVKMTARSQQVGGGEDFEYKTIRVYSNPHADFEVSPPVTMLDPITLEGRINFYNLSECYDTSACIYNWNFGDGETAISRDVTHAYKPTPDDFELLEDGTRGIYYDVELIVTTINDCVDSKIIEKAVKIIGAGQIAFPNAFTPDGFGPAENEIFKPVYEGVIECELLIYNRWGELIFKTKDIDKGWDGTLRGEPAKSDVYVWKALGKYTDGRSFEIAGDVTLIR